MRIALLADGSLGHVRRWGRWFAERGHEVLLLSFQDVAGCPFHARLLRRLLPTDLLACAAAAPGVRRALGRFRPDIVNAIYAGGYGFLGALSGARPLVVTTIGSDMLVDYPSSAAHRAQIRFALSRAALVTTDAAVLTRAVIGAGVPRSKVIEAVMGIDESVFYPPDAPPAGLVIASTRNLHPIYDVKTLVDALSDPFWPPGASTIICGDGPERAALES
ncbi:MAG: glycosyltransferase, partial [Candidatus Krumholzibacteria bacterium]|nr:glycosyltransferase [Candidatus Krumholzibacteria bacterium]